jgi:hypothetical protein
VKPDTTLAIRFDPALYKGSVRFTGKMAVAALVVLALALVTAPSALAKLPPSGKYGCVVLSPSIEIANQYLGDLKIRGNLYKINRSKWAKMVRTGGRRFRFKGGPWKRLFKGYWERINSVLTPGKIIIEIELTELDSGFESSYCTKE